MKTEKFNSLPKAEKRILIAKDVIKQLNAQQLIANIGYYISFSIFDMLDNKNKVSIKRNYKKIKNCKVCALGACLLSATKFGNELLLEDIVDALWRKNERTDKLLSSIFSKKQLLLIEQTFEGNTYGRKVLDEILKSDELDACRKFRDEYIHGDENPMELLIAIMKNIIKNKGTFKPQKI